MVTKFDLFEDMAVALESWTNAAAEAVTNQRADLQWVDTEEPYKKLQMALASSEVEASSVKLVFAECLRGFATSLFTALDGGTALAEKGRIYLVDENGRMLGEGLHEDFVAYLIKSGRLV